MGSIIETNAHLGDTDLIDRVKSGEIAFFEVLVRRYTSDLYRVARMYGFTHTEAQELVNCTQIEAFRMAGSYPENVSYRAWLTRNMIHNCLNSFTGRADWERDLVEPAGIAKRSFNHYESQRVLGSIEFPSSLEQLIEQLPVSLRSVFVFVEIDGYSIAETAFLLSSGEDNIRRRLAKAKSAAMQSFAISPSKRTVYALDSPSYERIVREILEFLNVRSEVPTGAPGF